MDGREGQRPRPLPFWNVAALFLRSDRWHAIRPVLSRRREEVDVDRVDRATGPWGTLGGITMIVPAVIVKLRP